MTAKAGPAVDPFDIPPPSGGYWIRTPDGGLLPADEVTARRAGLPWPNPDFGPAAAPTEPQE